MEDILIITAAGPKTWIRETIDPRSWVRGIGEGLISDYKEKMTKLREIDDRIHFWTKDFSGLINNINKELKSSLSSGRFVDLAILLADFNKTLKLISNSKKEIEDLTEQSFKDFDLESNITGEKYNLEEDLFKSEDGLFSEAGFFSDLKREWVSKKLETEKRKKRRIALEQIVALAKVVVGKVKYYLDLMSRARAYGNIGNYLNYLSEISKEQFSFEKKFKLVYKTYLKEFVDKVLATQKAKRDAEEQEELNATNEENDSSRETIPGNPIPEALVPDLPADVPDLVVDNDVKPKPSDKSITDVINNTSKNVKRKIKGPQDLVVDTEAKPEPLSKKKKENKSTKQKVEPINNAPDNKSDENTVTQQDPLIKVQNLKFLGRLVLASKENNPNKIASIILEYADNIDEYDSKASIQLTTIAEHLLK